jgi:Acetyltransferase (GNAT) domain
MIQFVAHKNIDKKKWDACIDHSSNGYVFAYSWYLDLVCENWSALILNDYEALFPITAKSKYKINYIIQPFFTRYFDVYAQQPVSNELRTTFLEAIPTKYKYLEICLNTIAVQPNINFEIKERVFQTLDMSGSYEDIQKRYSENAKRSIKKSVKAGLRIENALPPEKIVNLFKATKGGELNVFTPNDYTTLITLMNTCLDKNKGQSLGVYEGDVLCAAGFFMSSNQRLIFLKSGITDAGKASGAMYFLMDAVIKENANKYKELDFGGSSVENVAGFYKKFGAKDSVYLQLKKNKLFPFIKWIKSLKKE